MILEVSTYSPICLYAVLNVCERRPCLNGGLCVLLESGYRCNCSEKFEGVNCETQGENNKLLQ